MFTLSPERIVRHPESGSKMPRRDLNGELPAIRPLPPQELRTNMINRSMWRDGVDFHGLPTESRIRIRYEMRNQLATT
jgi:hypothetical protein